jgi:hypothetical protein
MARKEEAEVTTMQNRIAESATISGFDLSAAGLTVPEVCRNAW